MSITQHILITVSTLLAGFGVILLADQCRLHGRKRLTKEVIRAKGKEFDHVNKPSTRSHHNL